MKSIVLTSALKRIQSTSFWILGTLGLPHMAMAEVDEETSYSVLPALVHLEGVGTVAGVGLQAKDIGSEDWQAVTGVAAGDVEAAVIGISHYPIANGHLSVNQIFVSDATLTTQYARGTDTGTEYQQNLSGAGSIAKYSQFLSAQHAWYLGAGLSTVALEGYDNEDNDKIDINDAGLHDVNTTSFSIGYHYEQSPDSASGWQTNLEFATALFRAGQSDQGQLNHNTHYTQAISNRLSVTGYIRGSHGFVLNRKKEYDEVDEVLGALNGQCATLTTIEKQQDCAQLEQDLANYIVQSNRNGSAKAIGGAYGLRSYSEQFVKAANTLLEGVELAYQLPVNLTDNKKLEIIGFSEAGQASDDIQKTFDKSLYSMGAGIRLHVNSLPIRLEIAKGNDDTQSAYLTAGKNW